MWNRVAGLTFLLVFWTATAQRSPPDEDFYDYPNDYRPSPARNRLNIQGRRFGSAEKRFDSLERYLDTSTKRYESPKKPEPPTPVNYDYEIPAKRWWEDQDILRPVLSGIAVAGTIACFITICVLARILIYLRREQAALTQYTSRLSNIWKTPMPEPAQMRKQKKPSKKKTHVIYSEIIANPTADYTRPSLQNASTDRSKLMYAQLDFENVPPPLPERCPRVHM